MWRRRSVLSSLLLLLLLALPDRAAAQAAADRLADCQAETRFQIENDNKMFGGGVLDHTDELYTNGWRLSQLVCHVPGDWFEDLGGRFPFFKERFGDADPLPDLAAYEPVAARSGFVLGQTIYTPKNIFLEQAPGGVVDLADRPYAGFAIAGYRIHLQSLRESLALEVHVAWSGPRASGKEFQDAIHDWLGFDRATGWGTQVDGELGLETVARWQVRLWSRSWTSSGLGSAAAIYSDHGAVLGNHHGRLSSGLVARVAYGGERLLPEENPLIVFALDEDGQPAAPPRRPWWRRFSVSLFGRVDLKAIGWNATLEGPLVSDDASLHTVEPRWLVWDAEVGVTLSIARNVALTWGQVWRGPEMAEVGDVRGEGIHAFREIQLAVTY